MESGRVEGRILGVRGLPHYTQLQEKGKFGILQRWIRFPGDEGTLDTLSLYLRARAVPQLVLRPSDGTLGHSFSFPCL